MAWMAYEHLRVSGFAASDNPAILGIDRDVAAAMLCGLGGAGLLITRARAAVALSIVLATAYMLSARHLAGQLDYDALTYAPVLGAALLVCWPRLTQGSPQ
jgi:hypothetical protein